MKKLLLFIIVILALSSSFAYADSTGYTNISHIAIYMNADYASKVTDVLALNTKLTIIKEKNEWYNVKTSEGSSGWIEKYFVTVPAEKFVLNNSKYNINIRTSPTTLSKAVGQLKPGDKAKYIDTYHSWHIIEYKNKEYYVASWLTDIEYEASQEIYLLYDKINIREKSSLNSNVLTQGSKYESYTVTGESNGWYEIKLSDGKKGYVAGWLTAYNKNYYFEGSLGYKKTKEDLNLRSGPSLKHEKVKVLEKGSFVNVISSEDGWDKIITNEGIVGWCASDYLKQDTPLTGKTILLDPGHGGKDPGSISYSGKFEKYVNLEVAFKLKDILESMGASVYLTRTSDIYITNKERGRMADKLNTDILLSIHHNSLNNSDYFGLSTYYNTIKYKEPTQGYNLAEAIYLNAITISGVYRDGILDRNYEVLRETNTPAALIEIGFMSNPQEEMNIHNGSFQDIMTEKIAEGIVDYFN
ncbi:MAG: N-acetylmuramoyl-L-alanine amidase [Sedimentibacter sp.]